MSFFNADHPEIQKALIDLKTLIIDNADFIEDIELFGSTLLIPVESAKDIDFFISYKNIAFEEIKSRLLHHPTERKIIIENQEACYANCPSWERTDPIALHIILYKNGSSNFSKKLTETKKKSINITKLVLNADSN